MASWVNFTNILRAAFTHSDPNRAKKTVKSSTFLRLQDLPAKKLCIIDPYCALWCVFLREHPQVRFTELQLNKRLAGCELTSVAREPSRPAKRVFNQLCPTSLASAPKRKLAIRCCMGFYGRQSELHTHRCAGGGRQERRAERGERGTPREAREVRHERKREVPAINSFSSI